ncbi:DJ-1 family protein [Malacoplasma penetrans]|uniref:Predicted intracellular protease n=1 Tax=Malacoplasma penetrans (strain HF-2) TaxID=272633 RepID=Q8EWY0_MALP2|nr:DJ-1/PfpI family protein [Malacoplasma penetrans]RXY97351.1 DJ-1 family protein [Malacoplasma penetrans]BAC43860.1 predicted intracellular protease [Malacoplasma penetrans HF-2]
MIKHKVSNIRIAIMCSIESNDMDIVIPYDIWTRAGIIVETVSNEKKKSIFLQSGTKITCSEEIEKVNLDKFNALYIPGGKGCQRLLTDRNERVINKIVKFAGDEGKKWLFTAGAASTVLAELGVLGNKKITTAPGFEEKLGKNYSDNNIVVDKNFVSFKSPFHAFEFALLIVEKLLNKQIATNIANDILYTKK